MPDILLFAEDNAQEKFVGRLILRIAAEQGSTAKLRVRSGRGGFGKVLSELQRFAIACERGTEVPPEIIVVAVDANCKGLNETHQLVDERTRDVIRDRIVTAIADPHVERWLLIDGAAFREVVGHGCRAPDHKCEKGRYKRLLITAVEEAGVQPLLGGIEYAEDLAQQIDLRRAAADDLGLRRFLDALRNRFVS